jgi:hypothetical protein
VPLLVRAPGIEPRRLRHTVSHVDVMPTILELAGVAPPGDLSGVALGPALRGEVPFPERVVYCDMGLEASAYAGGRLVQVRPALPPGSRVRGPRPVGRAYDWTAGEAVPSDGRGEPGYERLKRSLESYLKRGEALVQAEDLTPDTVERLRALGYVD